MSEEIPSRRGTEHETLSSLSRWSRVWCTQVYQAIDTLGLGNRASIVADRAKPSHSGLADQKNDQNSTPTNLIEHKFNT